MTSTRFPLPLRNALAELVIAAIDDGAAMAALTWLTTQEGGPPSEEAATRLVAVHLIDAGSDELLPVHASHADAVRAHAARGLRAALAGRRLRSGEGDPVGGALRQAAALWGEGLFFEVHEVLEAVWKTQAGPVRQALQGVIQIAVAYHHLAHGNLRGARSLLAEGRERLASAANALPTIDARALLADTAPWEAALAASTPLPSAPAQLLLRGPGT